MYYKGINVEQLHCCINPVKQNGGIHDTHVMIIHYLKV